MKPAPFAYRRADTLDEALDTLAEFGDEVTLLAGGQSLMPQLSARRIRPRLVLDLGRIPVIASLAQGNVGAMVRQGDAVGTHPLLDAAIPFVGHRHTRQRGTIGGSLAFADPLAEIPLALLVAGGEVEIRSRAGTRRVSGDAFFDRSFSPRIGPTEMVVGSHWPPIVSGSACAFDEMTDAVTLGAAAAVVGPVTAAQCQVVVGVAGTSERPRRFDTVIDRAATPDDVREMVSAALAELDFVGDAHAEPRFRRAIVAELASRAVRSGLRAVEKASVR